MGNFSNSAEVGYYYSTDCLLSAFISNGQFYGFKIPALIGKLTQFFRGSRFYKNQQNATALKIIMFIEADYKREIGRTFKSIQEFNAEWIPWLKSLKTRFVINDGFYETQYVDVYLNYIRVSTYMTSNIFLREKGKRFSLRLRFL